jgi:pyrroloquinoline quinone biosynthesis protein B
MRVTVLGSAAGGGFPQWNCACPNCSRLRAGALCLQPRSQTQILVSTQTGGHYLVNASPDLRGQIASTPLLAPKRAPRDTPITSILLTSADVDSVIGLLHLREFQPLQIYSTRSVRRILQEQNRIFRVLDRAKPAAAWHDLPLDTSFSLPGGAAGSGEADVRCGVLPLGGVYPDYVSDELRRSLSPGEAVVGLVFQEKGKQLFYAPALPAGSRNWKEWAQSSDVCMLDGTFWSENELIAVGASSKTAREIGHVPLSGPGGLLQEFRGSAKTRKILIHINNTNPILDEESQENREVRDAGWEIAYDGMQIEL